MEAVVAQLQAVNAALDVQNAGQETAQQREDRKQAVIMADCRKACQSMPRYNRQKPWRSWTVEYLAWYKLHNIQRGGEEFSKRALVSACQGEASEMISPFAEGTQAWNDHPTCWPVLADPANGVEAAPGYQSVLATLFSPSAESELAKAEFTAYKQKSREDISSYISKKTALYKLAYGDAGAYSILSEKLIDGIFSNVVKRQVRRAQPQTEAELRQSCVENVAIERTTFLKGYSESTSLAGLESTTRTHTGDSSSDRMEIGEINLEGNGYDDEIQSMNDRKCYNCQKVGHYARECRAPRRGNGRGGQGGRGGNIQAVNTNHSNYTCHYCGKKGHIQSNCFQKKGAAQRGRGGRGNGRGAGRGAARGRGGRGARGAGGRGRGRGAVREVGDDEADPAEEEEYNEDVDDSFLDQNYQN